MADMKFSLLLKSEGSAQVASELKKVEGAVKGVEDTSKKGTQSVKSLTSELTKLGAAVASMALLQRATQNMIQTWREFEGLGARLKFLTKSSADAQQALRALTEEAAKSPSTVAELTNAYINLRTRGLDASIAVLRSWQDVAAASQKSLDQWVQAVLDAVTGQGERLREFGITMTTMKDTVTLSFGDMTITVKKNAADIEQALLKIAQVKFAGAVAEQVGTLDQRISNLGDAFDELWNSIGDLGPLDWLKKGIEAITGTISATAAKLREFAIVLTNMPALWDAAWSTPTDFGPATRADAMAEVWARINAEIDKLNKPSGGLPTYTRNIQLNTGAQGANANAVHDTRSELEKLNVPYAKLIEQYSELYGVAPKVTAAVMNAESAFKQFASSGKAYGLMQLIPSTFSDMLGNAAKDIYNVNQNIQAGTRYLGILIKQFGDLPKALAAYNAGPGRVMQAVNIATKEGITWQEAFAKTFPKAWKETGPYIQKVLGYLTQFGDGKYEIDAVADAQKEAAEAAKQHEEALRKQAEAIEEINSKQQKFVQGLQDEAEAAQDALLKAQDPKGYRTLIQLREELKAQEMAAKYVEESIAAGLAEDAAKKLGDEYLKQSQKALDAKYAAADLLEAYQVRAGWANSVLQGFDQLWSNMISGAETAMEALQKTLKAWVLSIANWLLKQAIIIPITAKMFNVSEKSLGGGLLGALAGTQGGAGEVVGLLTDLRGESQKTAENTGNTVQGLGGLAGTFGNLITGLAGGLWQFLAAILTALTTGSLAQAGESMTKAGSSIMSGMSGIKSFFTGGGLAQSLNSVLGKIGLFGASGPQQTAPFGGANWGYGLAGAAGYYGAGALYGNKGYSGMGGSLGAMAGYGLTAAGSTFGAAAVGAITAGLGGGAMAGAIAGSVVPVIGTIIGAVAGGALGSMFGGGQKIKGGTAYWNPRQGAGAAHRDTDPAAVELMKKLGDMANQFDRVLDKISGKDTNIFASGMWIDTDTAGQIRANYASAIRGVQKASGFGDTEQAAKWFVDQMIQDVGIQLDRADFGKLSDAFGNMLDKIAPENLLQELENFAGSFGSVIDAFKALDPATQEMAANSINRFAESMDDMISIIAMANDVEYHGQAFEHTVWAIKQIQDENESLITTYNRAIAQFKEYQNAMVMSGKGTQEFTTHTIFLSDKLAEAAGGVDQLASLQGTYFEEFYSDTERLAAAQKLAAVEVKQFNDALLLTGDAAIDTREEFRKYIEGLDLNTEAGVNAYAAALKLASAIATLDPATEKATESIKSLNDVFDEIFDTGSVRSLVQKYMEAIKSARELGATAEEVWVIAMQGLAALKAAAQSFAQSVGTISAEEFATKARQMILAAFDFGGFDVAIRYAEELERALQDAINAAIWKVVELKKAWEDFQLSIADRLGRLNGGPGVSPDAIAASYYRMLDTFIAAWGNMDLDQQLSAVNTMLGYIDQWVSASIAHINDALSKQVDAINAAADAQLEAINNTTDALQEQRDAVAEYYSEQIDALQEILDGLGEWVNVIEALNSTMKSLQYGGQNPIPPGAQMAAMTEEIARKMAEFRLAPTAELAEEIRALLEQRIGIASQVFQRTDSRYIALYAQTMELLREILAAAPDEADRIEEIQKEIKDLTKEQNEVLKNLDKQIEAQRKAVEAQTKAIEQARDAQIKAAEKAAERQRQAVYDTARILYEQYAAIGNDIYRQMVEQGLRDIDVARRTLDATHNVILSLVEIWNAITGNNWRPEDHAWRKYDTGTPYVPQTGPAILHKGERVLTVEENKAYGSGGKPIIIQIHLFENSHISGDPVVIRKTVQDMIPVIKREIKRTL